jgi:phage tail sheath gpL-like
MAIVTSLPSNVRRPGAFSEIKFQQAGQQLVPLPLRVVIVAEKSAAGTATVDAPIQVFDEDDADTKAGQGSFAAIGARKAIEQGKLMGSTPEIWIAPLAEPAGGTKAITTITVTVTTAAGGDVVFKVAGRPVTASVSAGDAQNTIASAIKSALDTLKPVLPVVASVATNVVSATAVTKGVNGNDVAFELVKAPAGVTIAFAQSVAGAGVAVIATAIQALYDVRYHAVCTSNHTTTDIASMLIERAAAWGFNAQSYRFFFVGERGSIATAQALQAAANDFGILVGSYEGCPNLPIEIAVADAIAEFASEAPNVNMDGQRVALYPASGTYAYTAPEIESLLNGGCTPHAPDGSYSKIVRMVTTQITLNGSPSETVRDIAYPRTAAYRAEQGEIAFRTQFKQEVLSNDVLPRVRDMQVGIDRQMEERNYLRDVDSFLDQFQVEIAASPAGRIVSSSPFRPAGPLHQLAALHVMYL